ncbi:hypothetical protein AMELA_G00224940 [Ameiurus melas]|uniref:Uncharacterized protein n=1 Tax=Ameiurus melas TaxID=219545 RepID=A0A7J5ZZA6_AMEME|nr:hypothetical protein AMELA_G00224940 [Ameiurus melas]
MMASNDRTWKNGTSSRGCVYNYCEGEHVSLTDLKKDFSNHRYLGKKNIPYYTDCIFNVANVCHVTDKSGLHGILKERGFKGDDGFSWWSLSVTDDDIARAKQNFTTSPAFQSESRYGNFRFTFNLKELLKRYSMQYCYRTAPILRVLDTRLYKQEIVYSVLVHPRYITRYKKYPRLPFDDQYLCGYSQGHMSWRCQSPSDDYKHCQDVCDEEGEYFVWDHVVVAFHMKPGWALRAKRHRLFDTLSACEVAPVNLLRKPQKKMSLYEAEAEIEKLKNIYL